MSDQPIAIDQTPNGEWTLKELAEGESPRFIGTADGQIVPASVAQVTAQVEQAQREIK